MRHVISSRTYIVKNKWQDQQSNKSRQKKLYNSIPWDGPVNLKAWNNEKGEDEQGYASETTFQYSFMLPINLCAQV